MKLSIISISLLIVTEASHVKPSSLSHHYGGSVQIDPKGVEVCFFEIAKISKLFQTVQRVMAKCRDIYNKFDMDGEEDCLQRLFGSEYFWNK